MDAADAYDRWHGESAAREAEPLPTAPWHLMTRRYLGDVRGKKVLEIGCGRGAFARFLADQGAEVTAADFSPVAADEAKKLLEPTGATVLVADIQAIPFPDESFDLVISQETLEHVPDPDKGLAELVRVTRRGGRLIVTTPNYLSLVGLARLGLRLVGRRYTELGQPINQPLMLHKRVRRLKGLGCKVTRVDATGMYLLIPGYRTVRLRALERPRRLMKWLCYDSFTEAVRL